MKYKEIRIRDPSIDWLRVRNMHFDLFLIKSLLVFVGNKKRK